MTLQEQLDAIKAQSKSRIPPEAQATMQRSTEVFRASGIVDRVVKVGTKAPDFTLPDREDRPVSLSSLLQRGPVVLSFYRGRW